MALTIYPADGWDSLVTLAEAQAYMDNYGHEWPTDPQKQEIALRKGTQYISGSYEIKPEFLNPIHSNINAAVCEAAVRSTGGDLAADTDGRIKIERTVDVITDRWAEGSQGGQKSYPLIDNLMRGMTGGSRLMVKLVRG